VGAEYLDQIAFSRSLHVPFRLVASVDISAAALPGAKTSDNASRGTIQGCSIDLAMAQRYLIMDCKIKWRVQDVLS
jgi:hypothetical protein